MLNVFLIMCTTTLKEQFSSEMRMMSLVSHLGAKGRSGQTTSQELHMAEELQPFRKGEGEMGTRFQLIL